MMPLVLLKFGSSACLLVKLQHTLQSHFFHECLGLLVHRSWCMVSLASNVLVQCHYISIDHSNGLKIMCGSISANVTWIL